MPGLLRSRRYLLGLVVGLGLVTLMTVCGSTAEEAPALGERSTASDAARAITLGDIEPDEPTKKIKRFGPLADYLAGHLEEFGITEGRVVIARDISQMAEFLRNGTVDIYFDSAFPTLAVQDLSESEVILRRWKDSAPEYWSVYVALRGNGVSSVDDFVGKVMAFEEPHSTSGYLLPSGTLAQMGFSLTGVVSPTAQVAAGEIGYFFTGDEQNTIELILQGRVAGGGISNQDYEELPPELKDQLIVFGETVSVPRQLVSVRKELDDRLIDRVRELLIGLDETAEGREVLANLKNTVRFDPVPAKSATALGELKVLIDLLARE